MVIARYFAMLAALTLFAALGHAQDGGIKIEKFTHSEWTRGIFSEAVTVTGIGNAKFVYLAGVGAEDENGPRGNVRHHGNFLEQCRYAYDKVKRVLAHHGASLRDAVKVTTYITDLRHRLTLGQCVKDTWGDVVFPTNTLIGVGALAFPEMIIEVDVTAIVTAKQLGWLELAKAVRKRYPAMPVLLCTGCRSSAQDAVRQGFVVLHKTFDLAALEQGLREAHSRKLGQTDAA